MATKKNWTLGGTAGHWIFLLGILLAVVFGILFPQKPLLASVLVLLGILVGVLNITADETNQFLLAALALIVSAKSFELIPIFGKAIERVLEYIIIFVAPAAVIVSLIVVWRLASRR